jgi:hypothetical protein
MHVETDLIDEITLYVPNIAGQVNRALKALAEAEVNLLAFSLEQAGPYGIVRLIVSDMEKAKASLQKYAFGLTVTKVFAVAIPHEPGALQDVTEVLAANSISIEYGYVAMPQKANQALILLKVSNEKEDEARKFLASRDLNEIR